MDALNPDTVVKPIGNYSNGLVIPHGRLLFVSGQVGATPDLQVPEAIEDQVRLAFTNVRNIVEAGGATMSDIVSVTLYLADIADAPTVSRVRSEVFPQTPFPTSTMIGNCTFVLPQLRFEVSAVALCP